MFYRIFLSKNNINNNNNSELILKLAKLINNNQYIQFNYLQILVCNFKSTF